MVTAFYMPNVSFMGEGCLSTAIAEVPKLGFKHALIVTDKVLCDLGVAKTVTDLLDSHSIKSTIYSGTQPNPTVSNVNDGLALIEKNKCDFIISLGGGSPHDCAKGVAILVTNGGRIEDYAGVDVSKKPQFPLICINTTAGTASEMTRFCIITDEKTHIKMALVDKNMTPIMAVNDPAMMVGMPKGLTAATGMDALTHAVEAYVSIAATPVTDACGIQAIKLIKDFLLRAVTDGKDMEARSQMAFAEYLAGMAFNNASLGYVHAMAHQLGGFYDLPHGVCNAILLPHVQEYNKQVAAGRLKDIACFLGADVSKMSDAEGADCAIAEIRKLSKAVGIPSGLKELNVKDEDVTTLAQNALKDACGATNPKQATLEDIIGIFRNAY